MTMYQRAWSAELNNVSKLRYYKDLQPNLEPDPQIKCNMNKANRSLITKLRTGTLGLEIELGRYQKLDRAHRICKLCSKET